MDELRSHFLYKPMTRIKFQCLPKYRHDTVGYNCDVQMVEMLTVKSTQMNN